MIRFNLIGSWSSSQGGAAKRPASAGGRSADFAGVQSALRSQHNGATLEGNVMSSSTPLSLAELEQRMAIVRDNIRQLIEQAAAFSGAEDEDRNADRLAQQQEELDKLIKERDALLKK
jgi:hypothetical protein